jgi:hypothetical protein
MSPLLDLPRLSGTPPKFTKLLTDILVPEGETAILECEVEGTPQPIITWLFNNKPIGPDERFQVTTFFSNLVPSFLKINVLYCQVSNRHLTKVLLLMFIFKSK